MESNHSDFGNSRFFNTAIDGRNIALRESNGLLRAVEIFKAGTFKDSTGELQTWTVPQLHAMVDNFRILRDSDKLPNVPVRLDHSRSVRDVVGYIADLSVIGDKLAADIEFTDQNAMAMYASGTLRSRSIEIRAYEDNDQVVHWPVVAGLAFVDLPAVEGLHSKFDDDIELYAAEGYTPTASMRAEARRGLEWRREYNRGGTAVGVARARDIANGSNLPIETVRRMRSFFARHEVDKQASGWSQGEDGWPSAGRIAWALWGGDPGKTWADRIVEREDAKMANHEDDSFEFDKEGLMPATHNQGNEDKSFAFTLAGVGATTDYAVVQNYVSALESENGSLKQRNEELDRTNCSLNEAIAEYASARRAEFVSGLAEAKKIAAPQVESLTALAKSLSEEQFAAFAASYDAAPVLSILGDHGNGVTNPGGDHGVNEVASKVADFEAVLDNLRKAGMSEDEIKNTGTHKKLIAIKTGA